MPNTNSDSELCDAPLPAYRSAYRADLVEDEIIDRRLACDPGLRRIAETWPVLNSDEQRIVLDLVERLA